jgi:hypothetical protein
LARKELRVDRIATILFLSAHPISFHFLARIQTLLITTTTTTTTIIMIIIIIVSLISTIEMECLICKITVVVFIMKEVEALEGVVEAMECRHEQPKALDDETMPKNE